MRRHVLALLLVAGSAAAQSDRDVVVTARSATAAQEAKRLARAVSGPVDGQLARMSDAACIQAVGLPAPYDEFVVRRIADAARTAGVPVEGAGCTPNIVAAFVEDGRALVAQLDREESPLVRRLDRTERRRLLAQAGPVRVVTLTELRSRDGDRLHAVGPGGLTAPGGMAPVLEVRSASIVDPPTRIDINAALVLVDKPAMLGKTLGQVADHVAVRALSITREGRAAPGDDTILTLFTPGATPPRGLTGFDRAYLRALYKGTATRTAQGKLGEITRAVARAATTK